MYIPSSVDGMSAYQDCRSEEFLVELQRVGVAIRIAAEFSTWAETTRGCSEEATFMLANLAAHEWVIERVNGRIYAVSEHHTLMIDADTGYLQRSDPLPHCINCSKWANNRVAFIKANTPQRCASERKRAFFTVPGWTCGKWKALHEANLTDRADQGPMICQLALVPSDGNPPEPLIEHCSQVA